MAERFRRRATRQLLAGARATSVEGVVDRLLAVQAQDPRGFRLAVRARSTGLRAADVERALTVDRSVVVSTLNRGTLHLVRAEDLGWLHALTTPQLATGNRRRLGQEGVDPDAAERGVTAIRRALDRDGPLGRAALRERVAAADVPVAGQAFVHVVFLATLRGLVVRGPVVDGDHAFVLARDWLGTLGEPWSGDREQALGWLAERYLAGHGPATDQDLAKWSGVPIGSVRRGLRRLGDRVRDVGGGLLELVDDVEPAAADPTLLGPFDPLLLGWADRSDVLDGNPQLVTSNGIFRPFALVDGRAVGTWGIPGGRVRLSPFSPWPAALTAELEADGRAVERFLGTG